MKTLFAFAVLFSLTCGLRVSIPTISQQDSQTYVLPDGLSNPSSAYSFGGFDFILAYDNDSTAHIVAVSNDTFEFVQQEELVFPCAYPQFLADSDNSQQFIVLCDAPSAIMIKVVGGIFFRIAYTSSLSTGLDSNQYQFQIYQSTIYLIVPQTGVIYQVTNSDLYQYFSLATVVFNNFNSWVDDLQGFNWTSVAIVSSSTSQYINLAVSGSMGGISVLAVISSSGSYSLISGSYNNVNLFPSTNGVGYILGYSITETSGNTVIDVWDFTAQAKSKPKHLSSTIFVPDTIFVSTPGSSFFLFTSFSKYSQYSFDSKGAVFVDAGVYTGTLINAFADSNYTYVATSDSVIRTPY